VKGKCGLNWGAPATLGFEGKGGAAEKRDLQNADTKPKKLDRVPGQKIIASKGRARDYGFGEAASRRGNPARESAFY